jgi:dTDP-4-dehydrorhamnose reductase
MESTREPLELWGGIECTVARIGDEFRNQVEETGHRRRISDLDAIASLGIRTLRYPVVWETIAPDHPDVCDWGWSDARLGRLRELGVRPIAGLVHHGSGPSYTNLLDPRFPDLLARHAERVAQRYPWLEMFTPVNEPLTTARFSGLYGVWYPHGRDYRTFLRALVTQCRATVLAMRAIRSVTPGASLIQTEDLGKVFSRPLLQYQADRENERRWLSLDLLCGRVDRFHPWRSTFLKHGIGEDELDFFVEGEGAPDIIGINHYLTSDRYLDERLRLYPEFFHGGNRVHRYADLEAVRMDVAEADLGPKARLLETCDRYRIPIAVTEAHHGCTREEQVRWLLEVWQAAEHLRASGKDIRGVAVWSLFGAIDWNSLLVTPAGHYEPGAFDVRGPQPRLTAVGTAVRSLAKTGAFDHPVLDRPGWWRRQERFYQPPGRLRASKRSLHRRLLISGASGTLGQAFGRICELRGLDYVLLTRGQMDLADPALVDAALDAYRPWAVLNAAGFVRVEDAERERQACFRANTLGAEVLASACASRGLPMVTFSSDLVFNGQLGRPYTEDDPVSPTCVYGESKAEGEQRVAKVHPGALIIRTSAFFGPWDRYNFVYRLLSDLAAGRRVPPLRNDVVSPTYVPDLVHAALDLLVDGERGIWHLANVGATSWYEFGKAAAQHAGLPWNIGPGASAPSQRTTALSSARGQILPALNSALSRYFEECEVGWAAPQYLAAAE